jgi:hypothetical protein
MGREEHLEHDALNDSYQSAYHRAHSTETVLIKIHSDIAETLVEGSMTALIMLDLTATFDVIDHIIPLIIIIIIYEIYIPLYIT